jgi:hypothetical protein
MTGVSVWRLLGRDDRVLVNQLRALIDRIDPVPVEVLVLADSLGQRIAVRPDAMVCMG